MKERPDIIEYKGMRALGKALAAMHPYRKDITELEHQNINAAMGLLKMSLKSYRAIRNSRPSPRARRSIVRSDTEQALRIMFGSKRKNVTLNEMDHNVEAYKVPSSRYSRGYKGDFKVTLGWTWTRNVYDVFYRHNKLDYSDYLVLKAHELRINNKSIRLYEGIAFKFKENKTLDVYIGQSAVSGQADIRETRQAAIERAMILAQRDIDKTVLGEHK